MRNLCLENKYALHVYVMDRWKHTQRKMVEKRVAVMEGSKKKRKSTKPTRQRSTLLP